MEPLEIFPAEEAFVPPYCLVASVGYNQGCVQTESLQLSSQRAEPLPDPASSPLALQDHLTASQIVVLL